ncbi:MAG: phage distal tail protein [Acidimicrobiales bacterium]
MEDWTVSYRGLLMGPGTAIGVVSLTGLEDAPDVIVFDQDKVRGVGRVKAPLGVQGRTPMGRFEISKSSAGSVGDALAALQAATVTTDSEDVLAWKVPGRPARQIMARAIRRSIPMDLRFGLGAAEATVQWEASDPRMQALVERSDSTGVGETIGGLGFPHGFPHGFGFATPGTVSIQNDGNFPAPWTATLAGPLSSPRIGLVGNNGELALNGFTLPAGQTLEFDSRDRTVLLNGTASRYGSLTTRRWFDLPVGSSLVQLSASAGDGSLTVRWRDTWI